MCIRLNPREKTGISKHISTLFKGDTMWKKNHQISNLFNKYVYTIATQCDEQREVNEISE